MSDELLVFSEETGSESIDNPSPVESSGVSALSSPAAPVVRPTPKARAKAAAPHEIVTVYVCDKPRCKKTYKTKFYFEKHRLAHLVSDAYGRMPSAEVFINVINELISNVLKKLLKEHRIGTDAKFKVDFIEEVLNTKLDDSAWVTFVTTLSKPLVHCLTEPSKLLPQNRYEEAQQKLNHALNNEDAMLALSQQLQFVSDNIEVSDELARKLVFRMAFLLLDEIQIFIAQEMQESASSPVQQSNCLSDEEIVEFKSMVGGLLRCFLKKGLMKEADSKMWRSLCRCLKENFIDEPVDSQTFLDKQFWFKTDDPENSIFLSCVALDFFLFVESVIRVPAEHTLFQFNSLDGVMSDIHNNRGAMGLWFSLTQHYFSEEDTLYVMKLLVSAFRELSIRLEEKKVNEQALDKTKKSFAVRTNLKRD